jgi:hypothetical protein
MGEQSVSGSSGARGNWSKPPTWVKIALGVIVALIFAALVRGTPKDDTTTSAPTTTETRYTGPYTPQVMSPTSTSPRVASTASCEEAPSVLVGQIDNAFTNGQHLEHATATRAPNAGTYIIGDITRPDGQRQDSSEVWLYQNGAIYAVTVHARRSTLFTDGRGLVPDDFFATDLSTLSDCIAAVRRASP